VPPSDVLAAIDKDANMAKAVMDLTIMRLC
jgi:hypothetical protein